MFETLSDRLTGVFGIATKYSEALLAVKYRITTANGTMAGGPMYVLERGMKMKWLGVVFALLTAVAAFGIGNMVQSNSIAAAMQGSFNITPLVTGVVLTVVTGAVILGGIEARGIRYEGVAEALRVPGSDLRLFGKPESYRTRRMGVALARGDDVAQARERAQECARRVLPRA